MARNDIPGSAEPEGGGGRPLPGAVLIAVYIGYERTSRYGSTGVRFRYIYLRSDGRAFMRTTQSSEATLKRGHHPVSWDNFSTVTVEVNVKLGVIELIFPAEGIAWTKIVDVFDINGHDGGAGMMGFGAGVASGGCGCG